METSEDVNITRPDDALNIRLTPDVTPETKPQSLGESSKTGVSTQYAHSSATPSHSILDTPHWYALRATYARERKAYEYIIANGGTAFFPTTQKVRLVNGKIRHREVPRIPNVLFAYGTLPDIQAFAYDNANLPYLRFYYKHTHVGAQIRKEPLIIPDKQIESLRIICNAESEDIIIESGSIEKFKKGQKVLIKFGNFAGVTGIVARYHGQQRVGIVVEGLLSAATAYIPSAFLEIIE